VDELRVAFFPLLRRGVPVLTRSLEVNTKPPDEERDVCAEAPAIAVDLVQHEVAAAMIGEDRVAIGRTHQQVLQHHVVGEQDVWRLFPKLLACRLSG
jgi:hypothetical protein